MPVTSMLGYPERGFLLFPAPGLEALRDPRGLPIEGLKAISAERSRPERRSRELARWYHSDIALMARPT